LPQAWAGRNSRPCGRVRVVAEEARGQIEGERRLADARRAADQERVRRPAGDHCPDELDGGVVTARPHPRGGGAGRHGSSDREGAAAPAQAGSAFLRVVRRFGAASALVSASAGAAVATGSAFLRVVVRRFGAASVVSPADVPVAAAAAVLRVDVRRFGAAAPVDSAAGSPMEASVTAGVLVRVVVRRLGVATAAAGSMPAEAGDDVTSGSRAG